MCEIIARDVLLYLNELGYRNIEAHQLKAFIIDLKKLIKQDQYSTKELDNFNGLLNSDTYQTLLTADTAKDISKAGRLVTVQISKPRLPRTEINYNRESDCSLTDDPRYKPADNLPLSGLTSSLSCLDAEHDNKRRKIHRGSSEGNIVRPASFARPTSSFIRVKRPSLKPCRSDPVALYHYYQEQWKQTKIPGQDSHADLRWTIREKLLGDHIAR